MKDIVNESGMMDFRDFAQFVTQPVTDGTGVCHVKLVFV